MRVTMSDGQTGVVSTGGELASWLDPLADGRATSITLSKDEDTWMQASADADGYCIEKREGGEDRQYAATAKAAPVAGARHSAAHFTLDEVQLVLEDYLKGRTSSAFVGWRKLELTTPPLNPRARVYRGCLIIALFVLFMVSAIWLMDGFYFE